MRAVIFLDVLGDLIERVEGDTKWHLGISSGEADAWIIMIAEAADEAGLRHGQPTSTGV